MDTSKRDIYLNKCLKIKVSDAITPIDDALTRLNRWWVISPDEEILFYNGHSAQCNSNKNIALHLADGHNLKVVFLPCVYIPNTMWGNWFN